VSRPGVPTVEDVPRVRGQKSPWRTGQAKGGRPVPTLSRGLPPARAIAVFRVLSRHAPEQRHRKHPAVVLPFEDVAGWAGCSPRTAKRALAALRVHGWITTRREDQPGRHGGTLDGHLRVELVMPPEVAAVDTSTCRKGRYFA
jgi:hypothetical protein